MFDNTPTIFLPEATSNEVPEIINTVAPALITTPIIDTLSQNESENNTSSSTDDNLITSIALDNFEQKEVQEVNTHKYAVRKKALYTFKNIQSPRHYRKN